MELNFGPRGVLEINNAQICYRNFEGRQSQFNAAGDRNFCLIIPTKEMADALIERGWNVKEKPARDAFEEPFRTLKVKVTCNENGPTAVFKSGKNNTKLDEETIGMLDEVSLASVDLDIRPYDWNVGGRSGRTAYLKGIWAYHNQDRFATRLAEEEYPEE